MKRTTALSVAAVAALLARPAVVHAEDTTIAQPSSRLPRFAFGAYGGVAIGADGPVIGRVGGRATYQVSTAFGVDLGLGMARGSVVTQGNTEPTAFTLWGADVSGVFDAEVIRRDFRVGAFGNLGIAFPGESRPMALLHDMLVTGGAGLQFRYGGSLGGSRGAEGRVRVGSFFATDLARAIPLGPGFLLEFTAVIGGGEYPQPLPADQRQRAPAVVRLERYLRDHLHDTVDASDVTAVCRASVQRDWAEVAVEPRDDDHLACASSHVSAIRAPVARGHCAVVIAVGTSGRDIDLRARVGRDEPTNPWVTDEASDDWPVAYACNFTDETQDLHIEGKAFGAPGADGDEAAYAAIARVDVPLPTLGPRWEGRCVEDGRLVDNACGGNLAPGGALDARLEGGTLALYAPELSRATVEIMRHASSGEPTPAARLVAHGLRVPAQITLPVDPAVHYTARVTAHDALGTVFVLAHELPESARARVRAALAQTLGVSTDALTARAPGTVEQPAVVRVASRDEPVELLVDNVLPFSVVRLTTAARENADLTLDARNVAAEGQPALAAEAANIQRTDVAAPRQTARQMHRANATASPVRVQFTVTPRDRDWIAAAATRLYPTWRHGAATREVPADALRNLRECDVSANSLAAGAACRLPGGPTRLTLPSESAVYCIAGAANLVATVRAAGAPADIRPRVTTLVGEGVVPGECFPVPATPAHTLEVSGPALVYRAPAAP